MTHTKSQRSGIWGFFLLLTVQRFCGFGQEIEKKAALQLLNWDPELVFNPVSIVALSSDAG